MPNCRSPAPARTQLRLGHTLKRKEGGGWKMDLSKQRDGHKTSRFYGPFAASLPEALTPILNEYCNVLVLTAPTDGGPYLVCACTAKCDHKRAPNTTPGPSLLARSSTRHSRSPTGRSSPRRGAGGSSVYSSATTARHVATDRTPDQVLAICAAALRY